MIENSSRFIQTIL